MATEGRQRRAEYSHGPKCVNWISLRLLMGAKFLTNIAKVVPLIGKCRRTNASEIMSCSSPASVPHGHGTTTLNLKLERAVGLVSVRLGPRRPFVQNGVPTLAAPVTDPSTRLPFRMQRTLLKSKIHRATVTDAQLHYEGSVTIDINLMQAADIIDHEQVHIFDVNNGSRLITYAIPGPAGSGTICINGAAAHLVDPGDLIIICCFAQYEERELTEHHPKVVHVDAKNRQTK